MTKTITTTDDGRTRFFTDVYAEFQQGVADALADGAQVDIVSAFDGFAALINYGDGAEAEARAEVGGEVEPEMTSEPPVNLDDDLQPVVEVEAEADTEAEATLFDTEAEAEAEAEVEGGSMTDAEIFDLVKTSTAVEIDELIEAGIVSTAQVVEAEKAEGGKHRKGILALADD